MKDTGNREEADKSWTPFRSQIHCWGGKDALRALTPNMEKRSSFVLFLVTTLCHDSLIKLLSLNH